jgi:probable dihydroxyacetone kinase regulator
MRNYLVSRFTQNLQMKEMIFVSQTTKRALEASLKNLLLQKPLDKITIADIAEDCGINRMTFYYHFKDIYDLVEWSCVEDAAKALEGKKTYDTWQQGFLQIFNAVISNKPFIMNVYHSVNREHVETYLYKLTYNLMIGVIEEKAVGMDVLEEDKKFMANFYKYAFVGLMLEWIKNGMKDDPQHMIDRLNLLIQGNISRALTKYSNNFYQNTLND